ncbi:prepilin-type N-terminal cleavage/methylation domain-containing protein [Janthinobacterium sp. GW460P]|uniref:pilus assembly FimT family protein n=1 Tax=unclassified Janthinobacterium TaxID=2610881 RepID=UPI000A31FEB4|nr:MULTISPECIES: prepilin-type N-terminal cleavage/methylation domain-containing protein [unclassified Janthinobacterium]MCC7703919.1 prepilin-type N-terminal cleavage/methylation domain-containing protein [Janthinobacterium sp. GW460P]MCC7709426.1 prepilin-type N-terminal cleavage/methylation domain-containing protein [Janthinobacterium sp. GW460W]
MLSPAGLMFAGPASERRQRGFTLVELVAVLLVGGLLAAVAAPRFFQQDSFDVRSFADQNVSMLRYAQKLAIAQNRPVFVQLNGSRIALCFNTACDAPNRVLPPAGGNSGRKATLAACANDTAWLCEAAPGNISYSVPADAAAFYFNALGRPFKAADAEPVSSFPASVSIGISGGMTRNIVVEGETGYVHY